MHGVAPSTIRTGRLCLSCWREADAPELRRLLDRNDAHLRPWIPFMQAEPRSLAGTRQVLAECAANFAHGEHFRYAIRTATDDELVGETMLLRRGGADTLEAGYWLDRGHVGNGYATEATAALLPVAFRMPGIARVILRCDERNAASIAVAQRLGAARVGTDQLTEEVTEHGDPVRLAVFERRPPA